MPSPSTFAGACEATPPSPWTATTEETDLGFLARRRRANLRCMVDPAEPPWIEHEGVRHILQPVDPRRSTPTARGAPVCLDKPHEARTSFDPPGPCSTRASAARRSPPARRRRHGLDYLSPLRPPPTRSQRTLQTPSSGCPRRSSLSSRTSPKPCTRARQLLLTGEPGVGKTCGIRALPVTPSLPPTSDSSIARIRRSGDETSIAISASPSASRRRPPPEISSSPSAHTPLRSSPRKPLYALSLLVDKAHLLHQDTLDHLHILLNYQWDSRGSLLSLVLIGLPDLRRQAAAPTQSLPLLPHPSSLSHSEASSLTTPPTSISALASLASAPTRTSSRPMHSLSSTSAAGSSLRRTPIASPPPLSASPLDGRRSSSSATFSPAFSRPNRRSGREQR